MLQRLIRDRILSWPLASPGDGNSLTEEALLSQNIAEVDSRAGQILTWKLSLAFVITATLLALPALVAGSSITERVTVLYPLAAAANPYWHPSHFLLLYVVTPFVAISAFALFLLPGFITVLTLGQARRIESFLLYSFGTSLVLSILLSTAGKLLFGVPLTPSMLLALWLGTAGAASVALLLRVSQGATLPWPLSASSDVRRLAWMLGALFVGVALLLPKLFWENFNLDGIEAFEYGRSLTYEFWPRWEVFTGTFGFYHNFWLFAFPNHWFITLLGPVEAAARLPFLLYVAVLFAALVLLIEQGSARKLSGVEESLLWLGLALYTVVQAFSTNYEPFYSDIAETAATDSLGILVFLAACFCLWSGRQGWFVVFALMTYFAGPGGLLLLGLLAVFTFLANSPQRWPQLRLLGSVIVACLGIGLLYEHLYSPLVLGDTPSQFSSVYLLHRLYPPTFTELVRVNALVFTTGILPALSLLLVFFRRRTPDWRSWVLAGVSLGYFGIMYLQVWTSLHQFTPVMLLPLVVFWRLYLNWRPQVQRWALPALATTVAVSLALSLPQHFQINLAVREFGLATEYRVGDYEREYEAAAAGSWSLSALLPDSFRFDYPNQPWGADEYSWIYYAAREKPAGTEVNYLVQPAEEPSPAAFTQVASRDGLAVYVKDLSVWRQHRDQQLPRVVASPLYDPILRSTYAFFRQYAESNREPAGLGAQP